jgi:Terminase large subunit, T4likevirus-type, N-terminal
MADEGKSPDHVPEETVVWEPLPRQGLFIQCPCNDVGYGGSRGGGKSWAILGDWIGHEEQYGKHAVGLVLRRERTQLIELIEAAKSIFVPLGYVWKEVDKLFVGPRGGRLRFAYMENDSDCDSYQGHEYTRLYIEEATTFPSESPINRMQATLRSGNGVPCQMKVTMNPGGVGHQWCKARYRLDTHPGGLEVFHFEWTNPFTKKTVQRTRTFIPARVADNPYLGDDYVASLFQVGSPALVKAWLEGSWDIAEGAFFDSWSHRNIVEPFYVPEEWLRFRAVDFGTASPFSVGWWAVPNDDYPLSDGRTIPRGSLVRFQEWYGCTGVPNVGLRLTAEEVARGVVSRSRGMKVSYTVLDRSCFSFQGGPTIAETFYRNGVHCRPADNARVARAGALSGWAEMRNRIKGIDGVPRLYVSSDCRDFIRTVPAVPHDRSRPEDVDTDSEDHIADECRYACQSRPWAPPRSVAPIEGLPLTPRGTRPNWKERTWKFRSEMNFDELHAALGNELGKSRRRRERV